MEFDIVVIGAGVSGLVTAKYAKEAGFNVVVFEKTYDIGGYWDFKEQEKSTHRYRHNKVSRYNDCFSDFPFPDDTTEFPHNVDIKTYLKSYVERFNLGSVIRCNHAVENITYIGGCFEVYVRNTSGESIDRFIAKRIAIASGVEGQQQELNAQGLSSFQGQVVNSDQYKDPATNKILKKKVVVLGDGNNAIDIACEVVSRGMCAPVYLSSTHGVWVLPTHLLGHPVDLFNSRVMLNMPWRVSTYPIQCILNLLQGSLVKWGMKPSYCIRQSQPRVNGTFLHYLQQGEIKIVPDCQKIDENSVTLVSGQRIEVDTIVVAQPHNVTLNFLSNDIKSSILNEKDSVNLYKNMFSPEMGSDLAFIGFARPVSGGLFIVSENQARWWIELIKGSVKLPDKKGMQDTIVKDTLSKKRRYPGMPYPMLYCDPLVYADEITSFFGAKPQLKRHPVIGWRLFFGSGGASQYKLQGPDHWPRAEIEVCKVPVPMVMIVFFTILTLVLIWFLHIFLSEIADEFFDWVFD